MKRTKSQDPVDRVGIYKQFESIPDCHRLVQYREQYQGRNVWKEFCSEYEYQQSEGTRFRQSVCRSRDHWKAHMTTQGRHLALATPMHVEQWCQNLLTDKSAATAYNYWVRIRRFYDWLLWHTGHPHRYSPVMLAVIAGGASRVIWDVKLAKWKRARERYTKREAEQ